MDIRRVPTDELIEANLASKNFTRLAFPFQSQKDV
jgi:hypothetical protein